LICPSGLPETRGARFQGSREVGRCVPAWRNDYRLCGWTHCCVGQPTCTAISRWTWLKVIDRELVLRAATIVTILAGRQHRQPGSLLAATSGRFQTDSTRSKREQQLKAAPTCLGLRHPTCTSVEHLRTAQSVHAMLSLTCASPPNRKLPRRVKANHARLPERPGRSDAHAPVAFGDLRRGRGIPTGAWEAWGHAISR
jgi:hypothetical protein